MSCIKDKIFTFLNKTRFGEKLLMTANIWVNDWYINPPGASLFLTNASKYPEYREWAGTLYADLDEQSRNIVQKFLWKESFYPHTQEETTYFFYNGKLFTPEERKLAWKNQTSLEKLRKRYGLSKYAVNVESYVYHHGLTAMPEKVLSYMKGKDFIDAGACWGDSTFAFMPYSPRKVYAFEPSPTNQEKFLQIMKKVGVPEDSYELVPLGLASQKGEICFSDSGDGTNDLQKKGDTKAGLVTLDAFVQETGANVGFLKTDLEGMGLDMLKGAKETILKHRPVLSLAIYHNEEEFFGIYPFLKELLPDYHFYIRSFSKYPGMGEVSLLGYPAELLQ